MVKRLKQTVREAVLDYLANLYTHSPDDGTPTLFTSKELREYCYSHCEEHDPQEPVAAMRFWKRTGLLHYECVSRTRGEYKLGAMMICIDTVDGLDVDPLIIESNGTIH
jgi:hypothetical protein